MKIYTKTGDEGQTGLIGGTRVLKSDPRIEAYGTIDELNSFVGLLMAHTHLPEIELTLEYIQHKLFVIGSYLATDTNKTEISNSSVIKESDIDKLESEMDKMSLELPELRAFILPGGSIQGSFCHVCRTISRRSERRIIELTKTQQIDNKIIKYTNRLSDYFFVLARYVTFKTGAKEILWKNVD